MTFAHMRLAALVIGCSLGMSLADNSSVSAAAQEPSRLHWGATIVVDNPPTYTDAGPDARKLRPGTFGDDYPRALELKNGSWLLVFTTYAKGDDGYLANPKGGNILVVMESKDHCRTWKKLATITDPGRDLDNGQMIQLPNGDILMGTRTVRWQESYHLPVYRSTDHGKTWAKYSDLDSNDGAPGALGNPDKGVYEPHFYQLRPDLLGVMYSTEKHVTEKPSYSQTVAEKLSTDGGKTWGPEIWVASGDAEDRPGMPVWTQMKNGKYIVVYEVGGPKNFPIYEKISADGVHWEPGLGTEVPFEQGAPYLLGLHDGRLVLTANNHHVAMSDDYGTTWKQVDDAFTGAPDAALFSSVYEIARGQIALMTGLSRPQGGRALTIRVGNVRPETTSVKAVQ
jgi:hypothetical protein